MALKDDLEAKVKQTFKDAWATRQGLKVPEPKDLLLSNDAIEFERATVLYADLSGSTALVESNDWFFAGEIYKNYLYCAGRIIESVGGEIVSYDGDRVMAIFIGDSQTTSAAHCALMINYAVAQIINPALQAQYPSTTYRVKQVVGIDTSELRAARTGVRGDNDIVWIGRAANLAAKLTELNEPQSSWVTEEAYSFINDSKKFYGQPPESMWTRHTWTAQGGRGIYGSTWWWKV